MNSEVIGLEIDAFVRDGGEALGQARFSPRKLVAIHSGVILGASLLSAVVSWMLGSMETAGGLSGMGTQAALSTAQSFLELVQLILSPFWGAGLTFVALSWVRHQQSAPSSLLEGFRRFKPVLSSGLMLGIRYLGFMLLAALIAANLILFTPMAAPLYGAGLESNASTTDMLAALGDQATPFLIGYAAIFAVFFALFALPFHYRYRMTPWLIMDKPGTGGMQAMFVSQLMTQRRRMAMFKLDLKFWWYYLAQFAAMAVSIVGAFLSPAVYWCCLVCSMAVQFGVSVLARPRLEAAWGQCYEFMLQNAPPEPPKPKPMDPKDLPWEGWGPAEQQ